MLKKEEAVSPNSCFNRAKPDEPCFVLLGRDKSAPAAIQAWIDDRIKSGKSVPSSPEIQSARRELDQFTEFSNRE